MRPSSDTTPVPAPAKASWTLSSLQRCQESRAPATQAHKPIKILLVDDHPVVIHGMSSCLAREGFTVLGHATNGREAISKTKDLSPDIVLMDLQMPDMDGLAATQTVSRETPAKIVVLTAYNQPDSLLRVLRSGARGCVLKTAPTADLVRAIETVNAGSTYFSNELSQHAVRQMIRGGGEGPQASDLSNREREILIAIAEGLSNKEIASRLNIAVRTVETHRERLIRKLNIHTTAGLTRFAVKTGLITVPTDKQMSQ